MRPPFPNNKRVTLCSQQAGEQGRTVAKPRNFALFRELLALALGPSPRCIHFASMEGAIQAVRVLMGDH